MYLLTGLTKTLPDTTHRNSMYSTGNGKTTLQLRLDIRFIILAIFGRFCNFFLRWTEQKGCCKTTARYPTTA